MGRRFSPSRGAARTRARTAGSTIPWATVLTDIRVKFLPDGAVVAAGGSRTLLELAEQSGTPLRSVCGGVGNCTSCRVRVVTGALPPARTDHNRLGPLVALGWRLACQHVPRAQLTVERPPPTDL